MYTLHVTRESDNDDGTVIPVTEVTEHDSLKSARDAVGEEHDHLQRTGWGDFIISARIVHKGDTVGRWDGDWFRNFETE
jgi:hypothetical protein